MELPACIPHHISALLCLTLCIKSKTNRLDNQSLLGEEYGFLSGCLPSLVVCVYVCVYVCVRVCVLTSSCSLPTDDSNYSATKSKTSDNILQTSQFPDSYSDHDHQQSNYYPYTPSPRGTV